MLKNLDLSQVIFIDIETAPQYADFSELTEQQKKLWLKKAHNIAKGEEDPNQIYHKAGIYAEFGKVICISMGIFASSDGRTRFRLKSFYGHDESQLLSDFAQLLSSRFNSKDYLLCAHNGKEFDFPYLCRRMLVNKIELPEILNISGKKPWEIAHLDTMELWKFGDYKSYTSLELLSSIFNIPTPKDDIDGSMVGPIYWVEKDLERIKTYCQKDVVTLARLLQSFKGEEFFNDDVIVYT